MKNFYGQNIIAAADARIAAIAAIAASPAAARACFGLSVKVEVWKA